MPLLKGKSKKAFSKNVETEMGTGKPQKQALAIAYSMKRKGKAAGGSVSSGSEAMNYAKGGDVECPTCGYSKGGEVANDSDPIADEMPAEFDDLVLRDDLEEHYTAKNSGDKKGSDLVKRAMKKKYS